MALCACDMVVAPKAGEALDSHYLALQQYSRCLEKSALQVLPEVFSIGLCGVIEADLELCCNSGSAGFL